MPPPHTRRRRRETPLQPKYVVDALYLQKPSVPFPPHTPLSLPPAPRLVPPTPLRSSLFEDAYAVTLPLEFPNRFPRIKNWASAAGIPLQPWNGVRLTPADKPRLPELGIGTTHFEDRTRTTFNLGVIGAFLAHRNLLSHIAQTAPTKPGTLIFEDDVYIPPEFYQRLGEVEPELPADWDILFLDKFRVEAPQITPHLKKIPRDMTAKKNWGMWAFIVKNSSIALRILPTMEHMLDVPDIQLNKFADRLNFYLVTPGIVYPDEPSAAISAVTILDKQK